MYRKKYYCKFPTSIISNPFQSSAKSVLHPHSQYSYSGGKSSCTYCALEASLYLLQGFIYADDPQLRSIIEKILKNGVQLDRQLGHRSCDEVVSSIGRYSSVLLMGDLRFGRIKPNCYLNLVTEVEQRSHGTYVNPMDEFSKTNDTTTTTTTTTTNQPSGPPAVIHPRNMSSSKKRRGSKHEKGKKPIAFILTKPPETVLGYYNPSDRKYRFVLYDSHPRSFEKGSGFYFFKKKEKFAKHLELLFPAMNLHLDKGQEYTAKKYDTYEANFIQYRRSRIIPGNIVQPESKPERTVFSSLVYSQMKREDLEKKRKEARKKHEKEQRDKKRKQEEEGNNNNSSSSSQASVIMSREEELKQKKRFFLDAAKKREDELKQKNVATDDKGRMTNVNEKKIYIETINKLREALESSSRAYDELWEKWKVQCEQLEAKDEELKGKNTIIQSIQKLVKDEKI